MRLCGCAVGVLSLLVGPVLVRGEHQTTTLSPVGVGNPYPYQISLQTYDFGAALLPTLQSYAAGEYDGKWVLLAGRTNGMHGFGTGGTNNFPPAAQNRTVWVIDPVSKQSWSRSLDSDPTVSAQLIAELSSTNTQVAQIGDRLYITGGYGVAPAGGFQTFNELVSIDLPSLTNWVMTGTGSASTSIRAIRDDMFRVTGGAMHEMNGRMHLVFGQNFIGGYSSASNGIYTNQVRSFDIIDDGVNLSVANVTSTTPLAEYRRRDLNVVPTLKRNAGNTLDEGLIALSGVFTTTNGAWTVPVQIDSTGQTSMADPNLPGTFKQAMNNYESARLGLYSQGEDRLHEVLFGGITLKFYDAVSQTFVQDDNLPFTSQVTQITIDSNGQTTQDLIGEFPALLDPEGKRMLFGANAQFFLADGVPTFENGIINMDALSTTSPTLLGYIFGGIFSNSPHTRNVPGAVSGASNQIFEVVYTPIPEPAIITPVALLLLLNRRRPKAG